MIMTLDDFFTLMRKEHPNVTFEVFDDVVNHRTKMTAVLPDGEWIDEVVRFDPNAKHVGGALMAAYDKLKPQLPAPDVVAPTDRHREALGKIYSRTLDAAAGGVRESELRAILADIRNLAHEGLK